MSVRLIPDLDDKLTAALAHLEVKLRAIRVWEELDQDKELEDDEPRLPVPLADGHTLAALHRIQAAINLTQRDQTVEAGRARRLGGDDRHEPLPLCLAEIDQDDVNTLAATARLLGRRRQSTAVQFAFGADPGQTPLTAQDLGVLLTRIVGLLDPPASGDTQLLIAQLAAAGPADKAALDSTGEAAYQRTIHRVNAVVADSFGTARLLH
ncbi:MAG: hypothetical protein WCA46_05630 [Actinocatenispora sp.]